MKKLILASVGTVLLLSGCGKTESLGSINGEDYSKDDFIKLVLENADVEIIQDLYIQEVMEKSWDKKTYEKIYEKYKEEAEKASERKLTEEDYETLKEYATQDSGMVNIFKKGHVSEAEIKERYEEVKGNYKVDVVMLGADDKKTGKKVKKILEEGKNVEEELKKLGSEYVYEQDITYHLYNTPIFFPDLTKVKEGKVILDDTDERVYVVKVKEKSETPLEEIENDIVIDLGVEKIETSQEFLRMLEDLDIINMKKELREYLEADKDLAE